MLGANRITPAGSKRVSRELRRGVRSVASEPTIKRWPGFCCAVEGGLLAGISVFILELRQQIQRLQRREMIQVYRAQFFQNRLRERGGDSELRGRRRGARREMLRQFAFGGFVFGEHFAGARNYLDRKSTRL